MTVKTDKRGRIGVVEQGSQMHVRTADKALNGYAETLCGHARISWLTYLVVSTIIEGFPHLCPRCHAEFLRIRQEEETK